MRGLHFVMSRVIGLGRLGFLCDEREKAKVAKAAAAKGDKRKRKRGAAKKKAEKQVMTFKSVIGMAGFDFGPCEHELEL